MNIQLATILSKIGEKATDIFLTKAQDVFAAVPNYIYFLLLVCRIFSKKKTENAMTCILVYAYIKKNPATQDHCIGSKKSYSILIRPSNKLI
jgi:hypothetical protein